jgi:hypothetical protein
MPGEPCAGLAAVLVTGRQKKGGTLLVHQLVRPPPGVVGPVIRPSCLGSRQAAGQLEVCLWARDSASTSRLSRQDRGSISAVRAFLARVVPAGGREDR